MEDKKKLLDLQHQSSADSLADKKQTLEEVTQSSFTLSPSVTLADDKAFTSVDKIKNDARDKKHKNRHQEKDAENKEAKEEKKKEVNKDDKIEDLIKQINPPMIVEDIDGGESNSAIEEKSNMNSGDNGSTNGNYSEKQVSDKQPHATEQKEIQEEIQKQEHHQRKIHSHVEFIDETNVGSNGLGNSITRLGSDRNISEAAIGQNSGIIADILTDPESRDRLVLQQAERSARSREHWAIVRSHFLKNHGHHHHQATENGTNIGNSTLTVPADAGERSKTFMNESRTDLDGLDGTDSEFGDAHPGFGVRGSRARLDDSEEEEEIQTYNKTGESDITHAIPYLPRGLAVLCLVLNICIPGSGTILSGMLAMCCGKPRIAHKDETVSSTLCINFMVGAMQFITITFMLVGWIWSLVWGIYIVILAAEYRREQKAKRDKELKAQVLVALNKGIRQWEFD